MTQQEVETETALTTLPSGSTNPASDDAATEQLIAALASLGEVQGTAPAGPTLLQTCIDCLKADDWNYQVHEDRNIISAGVGLKTGSAKMIFDCKEDSQRFIVYLMLPVSVPEEHRVKAYEYFTRANYGLVIGNFEMDASDGEVRYKCSVDVEGGKLTAPMIKSMIGVTGGTVDRFFPGLMKIIYAGASPKEAAEEARNPITSPGSQ
eukprot:CAMPEP_0194046040 /NCGR_PEP_ID=MMETSP0009_2-20130614/19143_1 /TAXON_ID=210454 /ORGANISM="Grammatophora oceanica, Strain CCMP 410" /LENGTH=206 /DNA_ID=CAMNT_0038691151 /DNA_START=62 /DNA_END=682 /DNA_ORIENTATION=-